MFLEENDDYLVSRIRCKIRCESGAAGKVGRVGRRRRGCGEGGGEGSWGGKVSMWGREGKWGEREGGVAGREKRR